MWLYVILSITKAVRLVDRVIFFLSMATSDPPAGLYKSGIMLN